MIDPQILTKYPQEVSGRSDPNEFCPCCGNRKGKIKTVILPAADLAGSKLGILHDCEICSYQWLLPTVRVQVTHILDRGDADPEQEAIDTLTTDRKTKNVRGRQEVNGELVS